MTLLSYEEWLKLPQPDRNPNCFDCKATPNCPLCGRFTKIARTSDSLFGPSHHRYACYDCPKSQAAVYFHERIGSYRMVSLV